MFGLGLLCLVLILIIYIWFIKFQISKICEQLRIMLNNEDYYPIELPLLDKNLNELVVEINRLSLTQNIIKTSVKKKYREQTESLLGLSHDLRTPLTSIQGYIYLMNDSSISKENLRKLNIIQSKILYINEIVKKIFSSLSIDSYLENCKEEKIDIHCFLEEFILNNHELIETRVTDFYLDLSPEIVFVKADSFLLERLFQNLLSNGLKYTESSLSWQSRLDKSYYVVKISNPTVIRSPEEISNLSDSINVENIFMRNEIHGMGLSVVKNICDSFHGRMVTRSENGNFIVEIFLPYSY